MDIISDRANQIDASGIRRMFELSRGLKNPINLSIGEPDFFVPENIKEAAIRSIREDYSKYTISQGMPELCTAMKQSVEKTKGREFEDLMMTCGVSGGLLLAMMVLINPGDGVMITDPYFVSYKHLGTLTQAKISFIETYPDFGLTEERLEKAYFKGVKLLILNSPNNPTGKVYSKEEIEIAAVFAKKYNLTILSDEIYDKFVYDDEYHSISTYYEKTLLLGGFSKSYGMPGWRLGYAAGSKKIISNMIKIQQYTFVHPPTPVQVAALEALKTNVDDLISTYKTKRDIVFNGLKEKFNIVKSQGAFYAFIKCPDHRPLMDFIESALKNNVIIVPGNVFSEKDTHFRLSFATRNEDLQKGVEILNSLV